MSTSLLIFIIIYSLNIIRAFWKSSSINNFKYIKIYNIYDLDKLLAKNSIVKTHIKEIHNNGDYSYNETNYCLCKYICNCKKEEDGTYNLEKTLTYIGHGPVANNEIDNYSFPVVIIKADNKKHLHVNWTNFLNSLFNFISIN